ncbi:MAG: hypothetical protein JO086_08385 [Acidimicrobiia bacterium]|nr:hypothetical protein [Acidimicrobiia bacterium]
MSGPRRKRKVNVAVRTNLKIAANVGQPGETTSATSEQNVEIRQGGRTNRVDERHHKGER